MRIIMSVESASQTKPPLSITITNISAYFHLPNPRILLLFIISCSATFSLGIAMILEWYLYSRHHPGYQWIVYYAPSLISLPILFLIICFTHAILLGNRDHRNLHIEPTYEPSNSKQAGAEEKGQLEHVEALQDQTALVPIDPSNDHPSFSTKDSKHTCMALVAQPRYVVDDNSSLKRTFSLPLFHTFTDHSNIKRRMSFG